MFLRRVINSISSRLRRFFGFFIFKINHPKTIIIGKKRLFSYYSQEGQDYYLSGLLFNLFEGQKNRIIVDVGCNHPINYSNSFFFEKFFNCKIFGIDPLKEFKGEWEIKRPSSTFTSAAVGVGSSKINLKIPIGSPELNVFTFVDGKGVTKLTNQNYEERQVDCITLKYFFQINNIKDIAILFIDVEGMELEVLKSIDFNQVIIRSICLENRSTSYYGSDDIRYFLKEKGYHLHSRILNLDDIFIHESVINGFSTLN